ncbi:MAG: GGDEF domain-containing protein [Desulfobacteraceae bacterium]|nr:GGDEF domain-containing protein [Desulfobacteraceae bacterium]
MNVNRTLLMPYIIFSAVVLMGWRYNNAGLILTSLTLALSYFVFSSYGSLSFQQKSAGLSIFEAGAFLLPVNLAFFSMITKRRIFTTTFVVYLLLLGLQLVAVLLLCRMPNSSHSPLWTFIHNISPQMADSLSQVSTRLGSGFHGIRPAALFAFSGTFLFLLIRFLFTHDAIQVGFIGTLVASFLGIIAFRTFPAAIIYFSAAGLILIITTIESSYFMAYVDELTGLQSRRSMNETLINLGHKYAIAMIDVDNFKKFNDTYGHKTGDQVLKMIAVQLNKITGSAKTFRYGGEEFAAIFPGKSAEEARLHLEKYRHGVASTLFIVRGKQRRRSSPKNRGKRKLFGQKQDKITVSIGVAEPSKKLTTPDKVLKSADKILYKAKKAGRNRVMV